MYHLTFSDEPQASYPLVFLVPTIKKEEIKKEYIDPFQIPYDDVLVLTLHQSQTKKKTPAEEMKTYIKEELIPAFNDAKAQYLIVADSEYFKILTKSTKVDVFLGYVMDCAYGPWKVIYVPNYRSVFYDPIKVRSKINQGMTALLNHIQGTYKDPGHNIIHFEAYPKTNTEIKQWLDKLLEMDCDLSIDIEAFSLKHHTAGIGTITFCWNKHEGIAFAVDYEPIEGATEAPYGKNVRNEPVRKMLREFFIKYEKKAIYHSISYDAYTLIYQLFMDHLIDTEGLLNGIQIMLRNWDDTKLISYLATNSCAGNRLSLKDQAQEYSGNYAKTDIDDITKIPLPELLQYNLVDGLSTWFVYEKHWDTLVADDQEDIYLNLFKPATVDIIQMQLTGMPLNMNRVTEVRQTLELVSNTALDIIRNNPIVQRFTYNMNEQWVIWKNSTLKKKRVTLADAKEVFNPNSGPQLQSLLYEMLNLPVLAYTESKQPSTDRDTLTKLINHTSDPDIKAFINAMLEYSAVNKILTSFIPAMEAAPMGPDGWHYLSGNFNLGGTLSGRLSSSDPNLQNLPANVEMKIDTTLLQHFSGAICSFVKGGKLPLGKLIKYCFQAPPGWLFCGLDFASLEDRISALTTKDPNKLKVYTDGYDGHSLRAYAYFGSEMPLIRMSEGKRAFKVSQGGKDYYLLEDDLITLPDGSVIKVQDYLIK